MLPPASASLEVEEIIPVENGVQLHTAFHYHPTIVMKIM